LSNHQQPVGPPWPTVHSPEPTIDHVLVYPALCPTNRKPPTYSPLLKHWILKSTNPLPNTIIQ